MATYNFHEDTQLYFPDFNYNSCAPQFNREEICDFASSNNQVGHQQHCVIIYWALRQCGPLDLGLNLGSCQGYTPYTIHVDKYGNGEPNPLYTHDTKPALADLVADMTNLSMFPSNCFNYIASSHSLEHMDASDVIPEIKVSRETFLGGTSKGKYGGLYANFMEQMDAAVIKILRTQWLRVLRQGGVIAMILPDHDHFNIFDADADHKHAWGHSDFKTRILDHLVDIVDVLEYDTLNNNFSFNVVLRKR